MSEPQHAALVAELEALIAARDRAACVRATRAAVHEGRVSLDDVFARVLVPLLVSTGSQWAAGSKRIWEEHLTSSIVRTVIESLTVDVADAASTVTPVGRTVLLACPSGEQHDLGLRMLTNRLLLRGWDAHFLGADTPAGEVVAAAKAVGADLVVLSAATAYNLVILRAYMDEVKAGLPGVKVGVGGPAFACNHNWAAEDLIVLQELGIDDDPSGSCELPETEA